MCLASWGCGPELGEKRDSHQRQRVPGERVREGSGLPGGGMDGKKSRLLSPAVEAAESAGFSREWRAGRIYPAPGTAL